MKKKKNVIKKEQKLAIIGLVFGIIVLALAGTYAVFVFNGVGQKENKLTTGTLILTLGDETVSGLTIANAIPSTDAVGLLTNAYTFTVKNTGSLNSTYRVKLIEDIVAITNDGCSNNKLPLNKIKYSITKNGGTPVTQLLSLNSGLIDTGLITPGTTNTYTVRLWIDYDAGNEVMGNHFHGKIQVDGIQEGHTDFTTGE